MAWLRRRGLEKIVITPALATQGASAQAGYDTSTNKDDGTLLMARNPAAHGRIPAHAGGSAAGGSGGVVVSPHHFPWQPVLLAAVGIAALGIAYLGFDVTRNNTGTIPLNPPAQVTVQPGAGSELTLEQLIAGQTAYASSIGQVLLYGPVVTEFSNGTLFLSYDPARADEKTMQTVLELRRDLISIQDAYVGKSFFDDSGRKFWTIQFINESGYSNNDGYFNLGSLLNTTAHAHETAHPYGFGSSTLGEMTAEFVAAKSGAELAKKNPRYLEELSKSKITFISDGHSVEAIYRGVSVDEVENEYNSKKNLASKYMAVKGGSSFTRNSIIPIKWNGVLVNPQDIPESEKVGLLNIPIAQLPDYGLDGGGSVADLGVIFLVDLERAVGEEAVRAGIRDMATGLNAERITGGLTTDYVAYYQRMRNGVMKVAPDKVGALDRHFELRFFGPQEYQKVRQQLGQ